MPPPAAWQASIAALRERVSRVLPFPVAPKSRTWKRLKPCFPPGEAHRAGRISPPASALPPKVNQFRRSITSPVCRAPLPLKIESQPELYVPGSEARRGAVVLSERIAGDIGVGPAKLRPIQRVEELGAELRLYAFGRLEIL